MFTFSDYTFFYKKKFYNKRFKIEDSRFKIIYSDITINIYNYSENFTYKNIDNIAMHKETNPLAKANYGDHHCTV